MIFQIQKNVVRKKYVNLGYTLVTRKMLALINATKQQSGSDTKVSQESQEISIRIRNRILFL